MSISATCDGCGTTFTVGDEHAGKRGRCKRCGQSVMVPTPAQAAAYAVAIIDDDEEEEEQPSRSEPAPLVIKTSEPDLATSPAIPPLNIEPWYYRFLSGYAYFIIVGGFLTWLIWTIFIIRMVKNMSQLPGGDMSTFLFVIPLLAAPTIILVATLVVGCAILLAVDLARNVRVIRLQGHLAGG